MICTTCKNDRFIELFYKAGRPSTKNGRNLHEVCKLCRLQDRTKQAAPKQTQIRALFKDSVLELYGKVCVCCKETEEEFLTLDHVNGGGSEERRRYNAKFWEMVLRKGLSPEYQVLCMNCNWAKGIYGKCPHQENNSA